MLSLNYEYRVIPAPRRAERARGVSSDERFALSLERVMNEMGRDGWEYVRADTLPLDERAGLTGGTKTSYMNMLVFRRVSVRASQMLDTGEDQDLLEDDPQMAVIESLAPPIAARDLAEPPMGLTDQAAPDQAAPPQAAPPLAAQESVETPRPAPVAPPAAAAAPAPALGPAAAAAPPLSPPPPPVVAAS